MQHSISIKAARCDSVSLHLCSLYSQSTSLAWQPGVSVCSSMCMHDICNLPVAALQTEIATFLCFCHTSLAYVLQLLKKVRTYANAPLTLIHMHRQTLSHMLEQSLSPCTKCFANYGNLLRVQQRVKCFCCHAPNSNCCNCQSVSTVAMLWLLPLERLPQSHWVQQTTVACAALSAHALQLLFKL